MTTPERILIRNKNNYSPELSLLIEDLNQRLNVGTKTILSIENLHYRGLMGVAPFFVYDIKKHYLSFQLLGGQAALPVAAPYLTFFDENNANPTTFYDPAFYWDTVLGALIREGKTSKFKNIDFSRISSLAYTWVSFTGLLINLP